YVESPVLYASASYMFESLSVIFFFFQAEDGIRDFHVTGVQTCALPIYHQRSSLTRPVSSSRPRSGSQGSADAHSLMWGHSRDEGGARIRSNDGGAVCPGGLSPGSTVCPCGLTLGSTSSAVPQRCSSSSKRLERGRFIWRG